MRSLTMSGIAALGVLLSACGGQPEEVDVPTAITVDDADQKSDIAISTATATSTPTTASNDGSTATFAPVEETEQAVDIPKCDWEVEENGSWAQLSYEMGLPPDVEFQYFEARVVPPEAEQSYPVRSYYTDQDLSFDEKGPHEVQAWMFTTSPQGEQSFICDAPTVGRNETMTVKSD